MLAGFDFRCPILLWVSDFIFSCDFKFLDSLFDLANYIVAYQPMEFCGFNIFSSA